MQAVMFCGFKSFASDPFEEWEGYIVDTAGTIVYRDNDCSPDIDEIVIPDTLSRAAGYHSVEKHLAIQLWQKRFGNS